jgi:hypothetical protein
MIPMSEVTYDGFSWRYADWSFDESDRDIAFAESAIEAWTAWRDYLEADMLRGQL